MDNSVQPPGRRSVEATRSIPPLQSNTRAMNSGSTAATLSVEADLQPAGTDGTASPAADRRLLVFPDPVAFRFLLDDPCVSIIHRKQRLEGYELYLVEQWACSRVQPTIVIVTYTGDSTHSVVVGVLSVPRDETAWSDQLRLYMKAVQQYYARPKETPLGELMVTNLSSFPSSLTVIAVPDGDIKKHRTEFIVNENLRRLGCSGRSGMSLSEPTAAARAKFYQLYKVNDKIPFDQAVIELVKLCQVALYIFDNLHAAYVDGLLCDITEKALTDWWTEFGADYYNMEPADGILGPTTVSALLGLCAGARNRLSYVNAPVSKDVFEVDSTERGIAYFQKYQKLERSRRLDRQTMHRLHNATAKAAAGEGWGVQKAVKSTVTEIGGKRGEIVLGMVSGRDKGAMGDIETLDLDKFVSLVSGEHAKWLWMGKPKRPGPDNNNDRSPPGRTDVLLGKDDAMAPHRRAQAAPVDDQADSLRKDESAGIYLSPAPDSAVSVIESPGNTSNRDQPRRGVLKSVARDARSGLGRIKDAVSGTGRSHAMRASRDETYEPLLSPVSSTYLGSPDPGATPPSRAFTWKNKPEEYLASTKVQHDDSAPPSIRQGATSDKETPTSGLTIQITDEVNGISAKEFNPSKTQSNPQSLLDTGVDPLALESSVANSTADEGDIKDREVRQKLPAAKYFTALQRRHSTALVQRDPQQVLDENRWPSRMSFGAAEEAVLRWETLASANVPSSGADPEAQDQMGAAEVARALLDDTLAVKTDLQPWVLDKIATIQDLEQKFSKQAEELQALRYQQTEVFQRAKHESENLLFQERSQLTEATGNLNILLNRLEYELAILATRVQDVEDGVANFEIQVEDMERRADELKAELETESWLHWAVRTLTGVGTGPNITQNDPKQRKE